MPAPDPISHFFYHHWWGFRYALRRLRNRPVLTHLIRGKRVLIVGSGPSAAELKEIPKDVLVFTCNAGLKFFAEKNGSKKIDLYICNRVKIEKKGVEALLPKVKIDCFVTDDVDAVRGNPSLDGSYERLLRYDLNRNHYLKKLIRPARFPSSKTPSVGIRLLQYALVFGAKEIYLVGIDLSDSGYFWGGKNKQKHAAPDLHFIRLIAQKYPYVYSLSSTSPLSQYLPVKTF